jgi:hypothetical protein
MFLAELKRRKVYRVAALYAAVGVAISLGIPDLFGTLLLPAWGAGLVIVVIAVGFPIAMVLAWAYEVKPESPAPAAASPPRDPGPMDASAPDAQSIDPDARPTLPCA